MKNYSADIQNNLIRIFQDNCLLTGEQYEEISGMFINLEADIQEEVSYEDIEETVTKMFIIFEFLFNTKALTLLQYNEVCNLAGEMQEAGK